MATATLASDPMALRRSGFTTCKIKPTPKGGDPVGGELTAALVKAGTTDLGADLETLLQRFPLRAARWLSVIARRGGNTEVVTAPWVAESRSKEVTFAHDLTERADIEQQLTVLARELGTEVVAAGRRVVRVAVMVRSSSFYTQTPKAKLRGGPSTDLEVISHAALSVLEKIELRWPVRLIGVRAALHLDERQDPQSRHTNDGRPGIGRGQEPTAPPTA
jgi:nucleotidyltransferase/DNA polymerase involved in DNA repair